VFHAIIIGHPLDDDGERVLDCLEADQEWLSPQRQGGLPRYDCGVRFENAEAAVAWFEDHASNCNAEAHRHVEFGTPGKNV
jgi:hypothetical protein